MKNLIFTICLFLSGMISAQESSFIYINENVASMHAETDEISEVVSQAIYGTPIKVIEQQEQWAKIETPDSYQGWCKISQLKANFFPYPSSPIIARVNSIWTHIYYVSDTTPHPPVMTLPYGACIEVVSPMEDLNNRWIKVRMLDEKVFWAQSNDFTFNPDPISLDQMIEEAKKFIGLPYRWGGNSSFGFDCSGFVQTLFFQMGVQLPRDASLQIKSENVEEIGFQLLEKGDLVFFGESKVTHVGIYLGDGQFIHSVTTNNKGPHVIQISLLDDPEWSQLFICGRRVIF